MRASSWSSSISSFSLTRTRRTDCTVATCRDGYNLCHLLHDHLRYNLRYNLHAFYLPILRGEVEPTKA